MPTNERIATFVNDDSSEAQFKWRRIESLYPDFELFLGKKLLGYSELHQPNLSELTLMFEENLTFTLYTDSTDKSYFRFGSGPA